MEIPRPVDFPEALGQLQGMLGLKIEVIVNDHSRFFGCAFEGTLERVRTLPPDDTAVQVVLDPGAGFFLDPADSEAFVGDVGPGETSFLEFRVVDGPTITVEASKKGQASAKSE
jgi:hypothetical protein